jgi:hypothetical protein
MSKAITKLSAIAKLSALALLAALSVPAAASAACPNEALREAQGSTYLPDCRAYELVSPPNKHGGDVISTAARTRAAAGEALGLPMAVSFASLEGFGEVRGMGISTEYLSQRTAAAGTSGWSTHGITPPQDPLPFASVSSSQEGIYEGEFSDDLTHGIFRASTLLAEAPNVSRVENLYARSDLRSGGAGSYRLLSDAFAPVTPGPLPIFPLLPLLVGTSADLSHVVFESHYRLTADAPACVNPANPVTCPAQVYESVDGALRLISVLPAAEGGLAAPRANAGGLTNSPLLTPNVVAADGSRVSFLAIAAPGTSAGKLYLRDDHRTLDTADDTTVQLNASERTDCAEVQPCTGAPAPDPEGPMDAEYQNASADGSHIFFKTSEQLTNDDHQSNPDLYEYNVDGAAGHHLVRLSVDSEQADGSGSMFGVLGVSRDGDTVYFVANGQFVAGGPAVPGAAIYRWHQGIVTFVGQLNDAADLLDANTPHNWALFPGSSSRVSADGSRLLFSSRTDPVTDAPNGSCPIGGGASGGCKELYLYDANAASPLTCVSCGPTPPTTDASFNAKTGFGGSVTTFHLGRPLSTSGRVFFDTDESLVTADQNGKRDVYEYDEARGRASLISSGRSDFDSYFMDASADGSDVFFTTTQQLNQWDVDGNTDLYDARIDGGFPEPAVAPVACSGEGCRGVFAAAPPPVSPGSTSLYSAPVAQPPATKVKAKPQKCPRGRVRRRVHGRGVCLKVKHSVRRSRATGARRSA